MSDPASSRFKDAHPVLVCTVGTSLFRPNLEGLKAQLAAGALPAEYRPLAEAYAQGNWSAVAAELAALSPDDRICGAEINSVASMIDKGYASPDCRLYFLHSQTEPGRQIADILQQYYSQCSRRSVKCIEVPDLQDEDPKRFRNKGLRHLAREIAAVVRRHRPADCAINATGGYKAQIAIAVVLGQALGVTVYYKHELFNEVIAFPPLPVGLDFELWMRVSGMLSDLAAHPEDLIPAERYEDQWDERYESLVERVRIDQKEFLELSPAGQIFYDRFKDLFDSLRDKIVPPPAQSKRKPRLESAGWPRKHPEVERFMERVTNEVPFVEQCSTFYFNPDLPDRNRFQISRGDIVGVFSDGSCCVKFRVATTAQTTGQRAAAVEALNRWLADPNYFRSPAQLEAQQAAKERDEAWAAWEKAENQLEDLRRQNQQLREDNQQLSAENNRLSAENKRLTAQSQQLSADNQQLSAENQQLAQQRVELHRQIEELANKARQSTEAIKELKQQITDLQAALNTQQTDAERYRRSAEELTAQLSAAQQQLAEARKPWWRRLLRR